MCLGIASAKGSTSESPVREPTVHDASGNADAAYAQETDDGNGSCEPAQFLQYDWYGDLTSVVHDMEAGAHRHGRRHYLPVVEGQPWGSVDRSGWKAAAASMVWAVYDHDIPRRLREDQTHSTTPTPYADKSQKTDRHPRLSIKAPPVNGARTGSIFVAMMKKSNTELPRHRAHQHHRAELIG